MEDKKTCEITFEEGSGLTGGRAPMLKRAVMDARTVGGSLLGRATARALAVAESRPRRTGQATELDNVEG